MCVRVRERKRKGGFCRSVRTPCVCVVRVTVLADRQTHICVGGWERERERERERSKACRIVQWVTDVEGKAVGETGASRGKSKSLPVVFRVHLQRVNLVGDGDGTDCRSLVNDLVDRRRQVRVVDSAGGAGNPEDFEALDVGEGCSRAVVATASLTMISLLSATRVPGVVVSAATWAIDALLTSSVFLPEPSSNDLSANTPPVPVSSRKPAALPKSHPGLAVVANA